MQASEICLLASRIAKGGTGMVAIAGQMLNLVLEDLVLNKNLQVNRVTQIIQVTPGAYGPFQLEADYLRTYDLFYPMPASGGGTSSGITIFLDPITMEQFDAEFKSPSVSNYPYEFASDLSADAQTFDSNGVLTSAGGIFIYPQTSGVINLTHRYMKKQASILNPQTSTATPWFAFTDYLVQATAGRMMGVTGDDRHDAYMAQADKMLMPWLIMEGDEQQAVHYIRLDPRKFRTNRGAKPVKSYPFS